MNFSGVSHRTLLGQFLRLPLRLIPRHLVLPILQGKLRGRRWIVGSSTHGCWLGSYELEKRVLFEQAVLPEGVVFDIGAHVGYYTLLASVLVGAKGHVFAFEPLPANFSYLQRHLLINQVANVTPIPAAVADSEGFVSFAENGNSYMGSISASGNLEVPTLRVDTWIAQGDVPDPTVVKIDVEGAELLVLTGMVDCLARAHPIVFLATHSEQIHAACCDFLDSLGYTLTPLDRDDLKKAREILAKCKSS